MAAIRQAMQRFLPAMRPKPDLSVRADEQKAVLGDYYQALASAGVYSAYRASPWPVERAVAEAYERLVWIFKSVEAISSSTAQLNFVLKKGEEKVEDHPLYRVLNKQANPLETGRQFRKRLSAQILLSKKGAFVEVTKSRGGDVLRMDLLPPGRTTPIPGTGQDLLSHYEVLRVDGSRYQLDPERVRWFREPHPLDPYSGVTPLEAAGMSIELDFYTRLYNVAFLKNDARPGGVLAIDGDMTEKAMERIERRFAKGAPSAGSLAVIQGQVSYIDLAERPRDMAYEAMSSIAKKEILTCFGVPESVIGDASGRTWDNAEQELYNYWTVTMPPHLDMLATGLDGDSEDELEGCFDTSKIEALQRFVITRRAEAREEFTAGLIRIDEYRKIAGYDLIDNEHTRALYLKAGLTEVATTEEDAKKLEAAEQKKAEQQKVEQGSPPNGQEEAPKPPVPPSKEAQKPAPAESGTPKPQAGQARQKPARTRPPSRTKSYLIPLSHAREKTPSYGRPIIRLVRSREVKTAGQGARESASDETAQERLEAALEAALAALMVRLTARAAARLSSPKARKGTRHWQAEFDDDTRIGTKVVDAEQAVDPARWESETQQTAQPLVEAAAVAAAVALLSDLGDGGDQSSLADVVASTVQGVLILLGSSAARMAAKLIASLRQAEQNGLDMAQMTALARAYAKPMSSWAGAVAVQAATATVNGARDAAARDLSVRELDRTIERIWRTRGDNSVRASHRSASGQRRALGEQFKVGEDLLRYPGDEEGSPAETFRCRCWLIYRSTITGRFLPIPDGEINRSPYQPPEGKVVEPRLVLVKRRAFDEASVRRDGEGRFAVTSAALKQDDFKEVVPSSEGSPTSEMVTDWAAKNVSRNWDVSGGDLEVLAREEGIWDHLSSLPPEERKEAFTRVILRSWHGGSGQPIAVAAITSVADRLGSDYALSEHEKDANDYIRSRPEMDRATRGLGEAIYSTTQGWLAERDITEVPAVRATSRGTKWDATRPWTSWSLNWGGARHEAGAEYRNEKIPASRVFSVPSTGFGTLAESEVVVLPPPKSRPGQVKHRAFNEALVRRDGEGQFADKPGSGKTQERGYKAAPTRSLDLMDDFLDGEVDFTCGTGQKQDGVLAEIFRRQGFDGLPELADEEDLDRRVAGGEREMFRAVKQKAHGEDFRDGDLFAGVGLLGNGTYVAYTDKDRQIRKNMLDYLGPEEIGTWEDLPADERRSIERWRTRMVENVDKQAETLASMYAGGGMDDGKVMRMTLRSDAKVITAEELTGKAAEEYRKLQEKLSALPPGQDGKRQLLQNKIEMIRDNGRFAALLGYDAVDFQDVLPGEFLVLNRSAVRLGRDFREPLR